MKYLFTTVFLCLCFVGQVFSQFEGEVTMTNSDNPDSEVTFVIKGKEVKMIPNLDQGEMSTIYLNGVTHEFIIVSYKDDKLTPPADISLEKLAVTLDQFDLAQPRQASAVNLDA